jgi:hypothetical protein
MMADDVWSFLNDLPDIGSIATDATFSLNESRPNVVTLNPTPVNSIAHTPADVAAEAAEGLPTGNQPNSYVMNQQPASKKLKLTAESVRFRLQDTRPPRGNTLR